MSTSSSQTLKVTYQGMIASIFSWFMGAFKWYAGNLHTITDWLAHLAQIGGFVIMGYSIMILRRNWKNGKNTIDPKASVK